MAAVLPLVALSRSDAVAVLLVADCEAEAVDPSKLVILLTRLPSSLSNDMMLLILPGGLEVAVSVPVTDGMATPGVTGPPETVISLIILLS